MSEKKSRSTKQEISQHRVGRGINIFFKSSLSSHAYSLSRSLAPRPTNDQ